MFSNWALDFFVIAYKKNVLQEPIEVPKSIFFHDLSIRLVYIITTSERYERTYHLILFIRKLLRLQDLANSSLFSVPFPGVFSIFLYFPIIRF